MQKTDFVLILSKIARAYGLTGRMAGGTIKGKNGLQQAKRDGWSVQTERKMNG